MKMFFQKALAVIKVIWKPLAILLGLLGLIEIAKQVITLAQGKVSTPKSWVADPQDQTRVIVTQPDGSAQSIKLPTDASGKQVTSNQVVAVGLDNSQKWTVQVKAEATPDFRSST